MRHGFCFHPVMDETLPFLLDTSINDMQYLIWKVPLRKVDNIEFILEHRIDWSFANHRGGNFPVGAGIHRVPAPTGMGAGRNFNPRGYRLTRG